MTPFRTRSVIFCSLFAVAGVFAAEGTIPDRERVVEETERAFAQTMAERDFEAFKKFLAADAVFFSGDEPLRGRKTVAAKWKPYFESAEAPFSWEPLQVVVLESGELALSTGPVLDPTGVCIGSFNSIWKLDVSGEWKIVFDKGSPECPGEKP